jgi:hypothetical protein
MPIVKADPPQEEPDAAPKRKNALTWMSERVLQRIGFGKLCEISFPSL